MKSPSPYRRESTDGTDDTFILPNCSVCQITLGTPPQEDSENCTRFLAAWPVCGHVFHHYCVDRWIRTSARHSRKHKPQCPICREEADPKYIVKLTIALERRTEAIDSQIRDMTQNVAMLRANHAQALKRVQDELLKARSAEVSAHIELQELQDEKVNVSQVLDTTQQELTAVSSFI
eukprot:Protomagalhaensia_wolfi_Nauph_80__3669@NODE_36_length_4469_cov_116_886230_g28_i0_p2_GENE_NODE_36_length_4469_cov_116_886230_g28_i0NODE_36_length_4469_cov_116_886230_g28_i0_p2_ORF_typecomplete_len177_score18_91zfrbx1/PF12678_7/2_3e09zfrbx1/PF12678_7/4_6e03zfANAPC11/PF12861_7/1_2e08zfRING_2/PF13639_6/5_8e08zfC3HC4/PF00097_25/5_1e06ProkRING_4/PF14447_6/2_3e03ProkRING_4/PF14447_6/0_00019AAA_13/PF13166_6/0_00011zfRING_5/PF14634_6/0_00032Rtf2/PF04641_12/0_00023FANCL_C/PF11793_8/0_00057Pellino/PF04710_